jgi:NitT/TauT family transport system substrate-binding protein
VLTPWTRAFLAPIGALALGLAALIPMDAAQAEPIRFAYVLADSMLPALYAQDKGYFKEMGLEPDFIAVQGGPAVVSAIASGEADIGYAAPIPPINAHLNGLPIKMFLELGQEVDPDKKFVWLVASKASGVTDLKGLKGKKIAFNANGGLCELSWRDQLAHAGVHYDDVVPVVLPFPDQEAALEQGNIDATCTVNPFYASMKGNAAIGAVTLAAGTLADLKQPLMNDALFAKQDWLAAHAAVAVKVAKVMDKSRRELLANRPALEAAAVRYLDLTSESAKSFNLPIVDPDMTVKPAEVQRILDAMVSTGMQPGPLKAADFIDVIKY